MRVYNLQVESLQLYAVGQDGVLVHNSAPKPPGWTPDWFQAGGSRKKSGLNWWDPRGGEWRYHVDGRHRPHWDYNEHDIPEGSPWHNVDLDGNLTIKDWWCTTPQ